jgi:orotidine-5'-phosphate decarboxylase
MKPELIVALDVQDTATAIRVADTLPSSVTFYKIGLELFTSQGPSVLSPFIERGNRIFLDLKLHDIPNTVAQAVTSAGKHRVSLLTLHASGGRAMLSAAAEAAAKFGTERPRLVAVTTLTSLAQPDLTDIGVARDLREHTLALGRMAFSCGVDGVVCSALEVASFRKTLGPAAIIVAPGIRPAGSDVGDQKRIATPASAVRDGANFLVVGRPILAAKDPRAAAEAILAEMTAASVV